MRLTELQEDAVKEVMTIGAGHASTALAETLGREVDIKVPRAELCAPEDMPSRIGNLGSVKVGVRTGLQGELTGCLLTIFSKEDAINLGAMLSRRRVSSLREVDGAMILQVASTIAASSIKAISEFFGMELRHTSSELAYDMLGAMLEQVAVELGESSEEVLLSGTEISVSSERFNCLQMLFLDSRSFNRLLKALEGKYG